MSLDRIRTKARPDRVRHERGRVVGRDTLDRGRPLEPGTRDTMESRFGFDFGSVRVHADAAAARDADALGATAFATGEDLFFSQGAYAPETAEGQRLLAHELTHVVQSDRAAPIPSTRFLSHESDSAEVEARSASAGVMAGLSVDVSASPSAAVSREGSGEGHKHKGGWMDHLFGLNPEKSFVESGMEGLGYGREGIWGRSPKEGEGQGTTALRALGAAATSPLAAFAAIGGHALDEINHGPLMFHGAFDW